MTNLVYLKYMDLLIVSLLKYMVLYIGVTYFGIAIIDNIYWKIIPSDHVGILLIVVILFYYFLTWFLIKIY